jgi:hypothetical protein
MDGWLLGELSFPALLRAQRRQPAADKTVALRSDWTDLDADRMRTACMACID